MAGDIIAELYLENEGAGGGVWHSKRDIHINFNILSYLEYYGNFSLKWKLKCVRYTVHFKFSVQVFQVTLLSFILSKN